MQQVRKISSDFGISAQAYAHNYNFVQDVISIKFTTKIRFQTRDYPAFGEIVFPPKFPKVPAIFSIHNKDEMVNQVNKLFAKNKLPDGTYEVKLSTAG